MVGVAARRKGVAPASVRAAVEADLVALDRCSPGVAVSGEALAVLVLASELDTAFDAPLSARVAAAREVREALAVLRSRVPAVVADDRVDELAARRRRVAE